MKDDKEKNDNDDGLCEALSQIPDRFIVAEEELDWAVQDEYAKYVQHLLSSPPQHGGTDQRRILFDPAATLEAKREMLVRLALCGTVDAYRALEQYVKDPDPALAQWSRVALYECRMGLESELLEEPVGIVSTGLGGAHNRLRYLVAVGLSCPPLDDAQKRRLESAWRTICARYDSVLEQVNLHPTHVLLTLLISMETPVGTVIDESVAMANGDAPILRRNYFVTNVAVPTEEEIQQVLQELSRDKTPG